MISTTTKKKSILLITILCTLSVVLYGCGTSENAASEETNQKKEVATSEYEFNGVSVSVPETWTMIENTGTPDLAVFNTDSSEMSMLAIRSETIPEIMRVDTGGDSTITSKEDVVDSYSLKIIVSEGASRFRSMKMKPFSQ